MKINWELRRRGEHESLLVGLSRFHNEGLYAPGRPFSYTYYTLRVGPVELEACILWKAEG